MKKLLFIVSVLALTSICYCQDGTIKDLDEGGSGTGDVSMSDTLTTIATQYDLTAVTADSAVYADSAGLVRNYTPASGSLTLSGADAITLTTTAETGVTLPTSGTLATTANIGDTMTARLSSAGELRDVAPLLVDTVVFYTFGLGSGAAGDTAAFTNGNLCGSFYNETSDTLVVTSQWGVIQTGTGTSTIGISVQWDDTLNAVVPTKLNTADVTITSATVGSEDVSFNNSKIPPKEWVWGEISGVSAGNKPKYLIFQISGYRIHTY